MSFSLADRKWVGFPGARVLWLKQKYMDIDTELESLDLYGIRILYKRKKPTDDDAEHGSSSSKRQKVDKNETQLSILKADYNIEEGLSSKRIIKEILDRELPLSLFIEQGVHLGVSGANYIQLLNIAIKKKSHQAALILIENLHDNAYINITDHLGYTPLHYSIKNRCFEITSLLIDKGADLAIETRSGLTILEYARNNKFLDIVLFLIDKDADTSWCIHHAIDNNCIDNISFLIKRGVDIDATNNIGDTPLHRAVMNKDFNMVSFLIDNGADINILNYYGKTTPLYYAIKHKCFEIASLLIYEGAIIPKNISIPDRVRAQVDSYKLEDCLDSFLSMTTANNNNRELFDFNLIENGQLVFLFNVFPYLMDI